MAILEVAGARKTYRRWRRPPERALDGLDLDVPEGGVFGFLGPNGSGKTTTIRILLGLIRADAGRVRVLGRDVPTGLPTALPQVGALVELPQFFPGFSGRENLRLLARVAGMPDTRVEESLDYVGLRERAGDRFKGYSLGMKQRLGIAGALLKRPRLLILDEPTNGLDPGGIREVRDLIKTLGADGHTTVFLSSHLLSEVQQVCDRVAILARGRCVASGPVHEVLASRAPARARVRLPEAALPEAAAVLGRAGLSVVAAPDALLVEGAADPADITRLLAERGLYLRELTPASADLESVFLSLTQDAPASGLPEVPQVPPQTERAPR